MRGRRAKSWVIALDRGVTLCELSTRDTHVSLIDSEECVEDIADHRDRPDRRVDGKIGQHSADRRARYTEITGFPDHVAGKQGGRHVSQTRDKADNRIDTDPLFCAWNDKRIVEQPGHEFTESVGNLDKRISTLTTMTGIVAILVPVALFFAPLIAKLAS